MQAQWPPAPYVGLWSRLRSFERSKLDRALARRQVTRSTLFRMTVHLVSARSQPAFAALTHAQWREEFLREGLPLDVLIERIERLAAEGAFTYRQANDVTPELGERPFRVRCLTPLVHVPPSGTWGQTRVRLTTAERWLGAQVTANPGTTLVRSYLRAFGPATRTDLVRFSGLRAATVDSALETVRLRRFQDEQGRELLDLPRAPLPAPETTAPLRFLPKFDALLLSHDDRSRVLPPEYQGVVIRGGDVLSTFLVDGLVAGEWRHRDGKVELTPFAPLPRRVRRELDDEAKRLASFHR